jgi:hypothetical protein
MRPGKGKTSIFFLSHLSFLTGSMETATLPAHHTGHQQGGQWTAKNSQQHHTTSDFLSRLGFGVLPLTEAIGHRALVYVEEYALAHGLRAGAAVIAATAVENNLTLVSSNAKHFKPIRELRLKVFSP